MDASGCYADPPSPTIKSCMIDAPGRDLVPAGDGGPGHEHLAQRQPPPLAAADPTDALVAHLAVQVRLGL